MFRAIATYITLTATNYHFGHVYCGATGVISVPMQSLANIIKIIMR